MTAEIRRLAAFTTTPDGGNPAGVLLDDNLPPDATMQSIAAEVGYSESAFLTAEPAGQASAFRVRYFSPAAEVDFCGHATIASGVLLGQEFGPGTFTLQTNVGPVEVITAERTTGMTARLTSVTPKVRDLEDPVLTDLLGTFGWTRDDLDPGYPPGVGFAGVWHPVLVLRDRQTLAQMTYDYDSLLTLMTREGWTTIQIAVPTATGFDVRDPFPVGGVVEDPATGAAAAAFGGYLRHHKLVDVPATVHLVQGADMGRTSHLTVDIPAGEGGISVSGHAVDIPT